MAVDDEGENLSLAEKGKLRKRWPQNFSENSFFVFDFKTPNTLAKMAGLHRKARLCGAADPAHEAFQVRESAVSQRRRHTRRRRADDTNLTSVLNISGACCVKI